MQVNDLSEIGGWIGYLMVDIKNADATATIRLQGVHGHHNSPPMVIIIPPVIIVV